MSSHVLADKDINANSTAQQQPENSKADIKSMDYHRQMLQSKIEEQGQQTYVSPSDSIQSPCTAKLSAYRSKNAIKVKPRSLFAQASAKNIGTNDAEKKFAGQ